MYRQLPTMTAATIVASMICSSAQAQVQQRDIAAAVQIISAIATMAQQSGGRHHGQRQAMPYQRHSTGPSNVPQEWPSARDNTARRGRHADAGPQMPRSYARCWTEVRTIETNDGRSLQRRLRVCDE